MNWLGTVFILILSWYINLNVGFEPILSSCAPEEWVNTHTDSMSVNIEVILFKMICSPCTPLMYDIIFDTHHRIYYDILLFEIIDLVWYMEGVDK